MPIYEYRCDDCGRPVSVLVRSFRATVAPTCPRCQSARLTKLVSRFAVIRSEEARLDSLADPSALAGLDEDDPKSIAAWARKMGDQMGDDLGDDFRQAVEEMEAGGVPGEPDGGGGFDDDPDAN